MLRKIVSIKNVGRFQNYGAAGDVDLKRYTLFFAENGRGKTTLCAILRSLRSGDTAQILGRTTLGTNGGPDITVLVDGGTFVFRGGQWNPSATVPNLAIFDSTFVSENVFSGDAVELDHRRNLYRVIVGKHGVDLARQIEELDTVGREKSTQIREIRAAVQAMVPQGLTIEEFLALAEDTTIDSRITEKEKELEAVRQAEQIRDRSVFSDLILPPFPIAFRELLAKTIEGVTKDAARRIAKQIETHEMHQRGEPWLYEGLGYVRNNACPFCGQSIDGVQLITVYQAYFSEAYNSLKTEIVEFRRLIDEAFSDREIARIERILDQNNSTVEFWSRYCAVTPPTLANAEKLGNTLRALRETAYALLDRKAAAPLDSLLLDSFFSNGYDAFVAIQAAAADYNRDVRTANATIAVKKAATITANIRSVQAGLTRLHATKKRYETDAKTACSDYQTALAEKRGLEQSKTKVKEELDTYSKALIRRYEQSINRLLDDFQAGFRITGASHGYPGGVATSNYQILINETPVDLGDSSTSIDRPSFKNTLSSGDRSTLALAFFLAQLEHDSERANKIVIFDDPFNSQDNFRKDCTVQQIKKCGDLCHQVIVLSHDQNFLKRIWDRLAPQAGDRKCLQLTRVGVRDTRISAWDIEQATQAQFLADRKALAEYFHTANGNPRDIVNKIRPVLESYCRNLYLGQFVNDALGTIIGKIRTVGATHQLFPLLEDLDALNEYTRRYHHGENLNAATEPINDTELQGFVKKSLNITGGC
jgi:wobble nucleotide-excising tRNase